jgi:hypothetical protein
MNESNRTTTLAIFGLVLALPANAGEIYFDEARVLDAQPVYETRGSPVQAQECGYETTAHPGRPDSLLLGDVRASVSPAGLVDALRTDVRARTPAEPVYRCRMVTRTESKEVLVGYRVRYEYDDRVYERRMTERPGDTIRVRIRLSAGRPDLVARSFEAGPRYIAD